MSSKAVLGVENAEFSYGSTQVFAGLTFQLDDARTALVGENGAGKSTLIKCLLGELTLIDGKIIKSRGLKIGYVPQDIPDGLSDLPVREVLEKALPRTTARRPGRSMSCSTRSACLTRRPNRPSGPSAAAGKGCC